MHHFMSISIYRYMPKTMHRYPSPSPSPSLSPPPSQMPYSLPSPTTDCVQTLAASPNQSQENDKSPSALSLFRRKRKSSRDLNVRRTLSNSSILRHMNDAKLISRSTPLVRCNDDIINRLIDDRTPQLNQEQLDTIALVNNKSLRDHFRQLTLAFLAPFNS